MNETIEFKYKRKPHEIPLDSFAAAMDKIAWLAWKAGHLKLAASFDWLGGSVEIPVTDFEFPHTDTPEAVCAHLLSYGLLDGFTFPIVKERAPIVTMTNGQISQYMKFAKNEGIPLFRWVFKNCTPSAPGWGGSRPNAGRKGNRTSAVSARVPDAVLEKLKAEAEAEGVSISAKVAEVLKAWADQTSGSEE